MSDRILLELAARAGGIELHWKDREESGYYENYRGRPQWVEWNALQDDGDALRLAVRLQLTVMADDLAVDIGHASMPGEVMREHITEAQDAYSATRRSIVRAAAEIQRSKEA